jgi:peptide/nickel transport system substrate-binding protein
VIASTAAAALILAACSTSKTPTTSPTTAATGFNAAVTGIVNPSDKKGGVLKLGNSSDADSYDPAESYYAWVWNFERYYVRTLTTASAAVGLNGDKLQLDLAASQDISADGKTYTYKLKPGVKFEDGSPITSKDIKYGIERAFASDVITGGPTYMIDQLDQGQKYPGPYKDTDPSHLGLKSVQTPDDNTIVFTLAKPFADFPFLLAMPGSGPVPQAKDDGAKYRTHPVSSGPYKFKSYEPGKSLVLVRNDSWDPSTDSVRKALPDEIDLTLGMDPNDLDNQLMAGTINIDTSQVGVQSNAQAKILLDPTLKANADEPNTGFIRYFAINQEVAPFDDIHCRLVRPVRRGQGHPADGPWRPRRGWRYRHQHAPAEHQGLRPEPDSVHRHRRLPGQGEGDRRDVEVCRGQGLQRRGRLQDGHRQHQQGQGPAGCSGSPGCSGAGRHPRDPRPDGRVELLRRDHRNAVERQGQGLRHHERRLGC